MAEFDVGVFGDGSGFDLDLLLAGVELATEEILSPTGEDFNFPSVDFELLVKASSFKCLDGPLGEAVVSDEVAE